MYVFGVLRSHGSLLLSAAHQCKIRFRERNANRRKCLGATEVVIAALEAPRFHFGFRRADRFSLGVFHVYLFLLIGHMVVGV